MILIVVSGTRTKLHMGGPKTNLNQPNTIDKTQGYHIN